MISNKLPLVALGVACVTAAGGRSVPGHAAGRDHCAGSGPPAAEPRRHSRSAGDRGRRRRASARRPLDRPHRARRGRATAGARGRPAPRTHGSAATRRPSRRRSADSPRQRSSGAGRAAHRQQVSRPPAPPPVEDARSSRSSCRELRGRRTTRVFEELVVSADSVIGLQLDSTISSEQRPRRGSRRGAGRARRPRRRRAAPFRPARSALGSVTFVERGGKFKERARLGIRFHTLVLADGTRLPVSTETITRFGDAPGNGSAAKIGGGAVAGAILGAIIGGAKGAAIGATLRRGRAERPS